MPLDDIALRVADALGIPAPDARAHTARVAAAHVGPRARYFTTAEADAVLEEATA